MSSPDWAIQDNNNDLRQQFSYSRARGYFLNALVTPGPASMAGGRNEAWGLLFQSLGQVVHHIQDMAQPQHTRNDGHADYFETLGNIPVGTLRHPSRFERHARTRQGELKIASAISDAIVPVFPRHAQYFHLPRHFWTGDGRGLADYSNRNFVSWGTNFIATANGAPMKNPYFDFPTPRPNPVTLTPVEAFSPDLVPAVVSIFCEGLESLPCSMTFYANEWSDPLDGTLFVNGRASTESIFDEDLAIPVSYNAENGDVTTTRFFALNQINFDASLAFLAPRAVAYSAGLINYFFRGEMEISLPDDGVYAIVDHHAQRCKDACGFTKVKVKLKNTTPSESMRAGALRAVAKFHRNDCYAEDLSGEPGGAGFTGFSCRKSDEDAVVSELILIDRLDSQAQDSFTFTFPTAIPINATDLILQVVFFGTLGEEKGAVAVVTKDISEPNYVAITNDTDMVYGYADHRYHPFPYAGYGAPDTLRNMSVAFRPNGSPLATLSQLSAPGHSQLAFLTDPGMQYLDIRYSSLNYTVGSPSKGEIPVSEFVSIPNTTLYGRTVEFQRSRGMVRNIQIPHRLPADWMIHSCVAEGELCAQTTMPVLSPTTAVEWTINF